MKLGILKFRLFEAKTYFLNIKQEQLELKMPPQGKEKGFKAILSQPRYVEVSCGNFCSAHLGLWGEACGYAPVWAEWERALSASLIWDPIRCPSDQAKEVGKKSGH